VYEQFGFGVGSDGRQRFQLFMPDVGVDTFQYFRGGPSGISAVRVTGDFLSKVDAGLTDWSPADGLVLKPQAHPNGILYEAVLPKALPAGYYEYKYVVDFAVERNRWVCDPCAKVSGRSDGNSAFVVDSAVLAPLQSMPAAPLRDLCIYEVMVDDFTRGFRGTRAPLAALVDKVPYIGGLGVNGIELMPCCARPDNEGFSWGYDPVQFFAIENSYVEDPATPLDRRQRLQDFVKAAHAQSLRVFLDIVLQHAKADTAQFGFAYAFLWEDPTESPFCGNFSDAPTFGSRPLDYNNLCTLQFASDVCAYWLSTFGLDGLRFDQTSGFFRSADVGEGLPAILTLTNRSRLKAGQVVVPMVLEDSWDYGAINRTNFAGATGCWLDPYRQKLDDAVDTGPSTQIVRALDASRDFAPGSSPVIYLENHDHSGIAQRAGGRGNWFRTQPAAIALFTSPGAVLLRNGQELGWDVLLWEDDSNAPAEFKRVQPRTVPLALAGDSIGKSLAGLYARLAQIRSARPGLRGPNFYPSPYDESQAGFDSMGYGVNVGRELVIYHRWGNGGNGTERFMVVLNFGGGDQTVDVPMPIDGAWTDLLGGPGIQATQGWARSVLVTSNWGKILFRSD
jgi:pullulanase